MMKIDGHKMIKLTSTAHVNSIQNAIEYLCSKNFCSPLLPIIALCEPVIEKSETIFDKEVQTTCRNGFLIEYSDFRKSWLAKMKLRNDWSVPDATKS